MTKSKAELLEEFLLDGESQKEVELNDDGLKFTFRGITLADIIVKQDIIKNLYSALNNRIPGTEIMDNLFKDISKDSYKIINDCLVYEEEKIIFTKDIYDRLPSDVINEIILTIIELTLPSKKKIQSMINQINRIEKKKDHLSPMMEMFMKRMK